MRKRRIINVMVGIFSIILFGQLAHSYYQLQQLQQQISEKVLRFHVLANSDSESDQNLKLKVRDAVGNYMHNQFAIFEEKEEKLNQEEAKQFAEENLFRIEEVAKQTIQEEGYDYDVVATIGEVDFPVKTYGDYTFPGGTYEALNLTIGNGEGHNWWCVMYPNMCFSGTMYEVVSDDAEEALKEVLDEEEYQAILSSGDYEVRFKIVEYLEKILRY